MKKVFLLNILLFLVFNVAGCQNYKPETIEDLKYLVEKKKVKLDRIDTSQITDMSFLFYKSERKDFSGIENWDVSNVKNMAGMFQGASNFNQDISKWNVSNVEDMAGMFYKLSNFNSDISNWDVSNVETMEHMFRGAESFNQDISNWDISYVRNMTKMFYGAKSFNQDLNKWDIDGDYPKREHIFVKCPVAKNPPKWHKWYIEDD